MKSKPDTSLAIAADSNTDIHRLVGVETGQFAGPAPKRKPSAGQPIERWFHELEGAKPNNPIATCEGSQPSSRGLAGQKSELPIGSGSKVARISTEVATLLTSAKNGK